MIYDLIVTALASIGVFAIVVYGYWTLEKSRDYRGVEE